MEGSANFHSWGEFATSRNMVRKRREHPIGKGIAHIETFNSCMYAYNVLKSGRAPMT